MKTKLEAYCIVQSCADTGHLRGRRAAVAIGRPSLVLSGPL